MAICTQCGYSLAAGVRFCTNCGTPQPQAPSESAALPPGVCTHCGTALKQGAAFCVECGTRVSQALAEPPLPAYTAPAEPPAPFPPEAPREEPVVERPPFAFEPVAAVPPAPDAPQCQFCGMPLRAGAAFCIECGASVESQPVWVTGGPTAGFTEPAAPVPGERAMPELEIGGAPPAPAWNAAESPSAYASPKPDVLSAALRDSFPWPEEAPVAPGPLAQSTPPGAAWEPTAYLAAPSPQCPACGALMNPAAVFCVECGARVVATPASVVAAASPLPPAAGSPARVAPPASLPYQPPPANLPARTSGGSGVGKILAAVLVLFVVLGGSYWAYQRYIRGGSNTTSQDVPFTPPGEAASGPIAEGASEAAGTPATGQAGAPESFSPQQQSPPTFDQPVESPGGWRAGMEPTTKKAPPPEFPTGSAPSLPPPVSKSGPPGSAAVGGFEPNTTYPAGAPPAGAPPLPTAAPGELNVSQMPPQMTAPDAPAGGMTAGKVGPPPTPAAPAPPPRPQLPSSAVITWTGTLERNATLTIEGASPSSGSLSSGLPGVPVMIEVLNPDVGVAEAPSPSNGWKKLVLRSKKKIQTPIAIRWRQLE